MTQITEEGTDAST